MNDFEIKLKIVELSLTGIQIVLDVILYIYTSHSRKKLK